jgi:hypothetical protein
MTEFNIRSDSINVEQIMEQIRARIREKRGVDYTEEQIRQLATVKLEKFLDPRGVRSDLLEEFKRVQAPYQPDEQPNYTFEEHTLFASTRAPLRWVRRLLLPVLKLFINPNPLIQALNIQSRLNTMHAEREARREASARALNQLHYEVLHNLVVETTRAGIEVKNLKMRVESLASRLEFNERRARALESVVVYKPEAGREDDLAPREVPASRAAESGPGAPPGPPVEGPGQRSRRRRRRRGRRGGGSVASVMGPGPAVPPTAGTQAAPAEAVGPSSSEPPAPGAAVEPGPEAPNSEQ